MNSCTGAGPIRDVSQISTRDLCPPAFCPATIIAAQPTEGKGRMADQPLHVSGPQWNALEAHPEDTDNTALRSRLINLIGETVQSWGLRQVQAASVLGLTQPRLSNLIRGRADRFSLDALIGLAKRAGLTVRIEVSRTAG